MEYKELDAEAIANIRSARVRQYEEQHLTAVLDEEAATAVSDAKGIKHAKDRQADFEKAIAAVRGK